MKGISQETEKNCKRNCKGTVKKCTLIRKRRKKFRKIELNISKKKGDQQFTVEGRTLEITVDFVLQARAKMSDNKVNGPDDQAAALGQNLHCYEVFSGTLHGPDGISKFVEDREIGLLEKTRCCPGKRDQ